LALLALASFPFRSIFTDELDERPECGTFAIPMSLECSRIVWPAFTVRDMAMVGRVPCVFENQKVLSVGKIYRED